jgi:excisionase family DNA binding protein
MPNNKSTVKLSKTLRISEAARLLGVSIMTLRRWDKSGYFKPLRIGPRRERRYKKEQILKILKNGI